MSSNKVLTLSALRRTVWWYHIVSATVGFALLAPFAYKGMKNGIFSEFFGPLFFILMYFPFLVASYGFLKMKRWAYFLILCFYFLEIISVTPFFEFKLSLFHYSIVFPLVGFRVGVDVISSVILITFLVVGREYLTGTKQTIE